MGKPEELGMDLEERAKLREKLAGVRELIKSSCRMFGELKVYSASDMAITAIIDVLDVIVARLP